MAQPQKWINEKGNAPVTGVALRSLQSRLAAVQHYLPLAALNYQDDIEYIHRLRIWIRRADAAFDTYGELLPELRAAWIVKQLRRIRRATNEARDADVFALRLSTDKSSTAASLLKHVREHRRVTQQPVVEVYERLTRHSGRFGRRIKKLLKRVRLRGTRSKSKEPTYREWAVEHLRPLFENFLEAGAGDLENTERLHQFRIAGKKLRYATELLSGAFDSRLRDVTYEFLETLQDKLGTINDHASALTRISNWNDENGNEERHRYLAEMRCDEQKQLDLARQHFTEWWSVEQQTKTRAAFQETLNAVSDLK